VFSVFKVGLRLVEVKVEVVTVVTVAVVVFVVTIVGIIEISCAGNVKGFSGSGYPYPRVVV
jgi:hypothetical protein